MISDTIVLFYCSLFHFELFSFVKNIHIKAKKERREKTKKFILFLLICKNLLKKLHRFHTNNIDTPWNSMNFLFVIKIQRKNEFNKMRKCIRLIWVSFRQTFEINALNLRNGKKKIKFGTATNSKVNGKMCIFGHISWNKK